MAPTTTSSPMPVTPPPWQRALVTGGTGFLGSHVCERLLDFGVEVDCVDTPPPDSADAVGALTGRPGLRLLEHDITAPGAQDALAGPYDLVLHLAGCAPPAGPPRCPLETLDAGSLGTRNALTVAHRDGARFLLASTCQVYGDPPGRAPHAEGAGPADPLGARSAYDEAQRFSETLTAAYASARGADAGIVRVFPAYGPRMRAHDGQEIPVFIRQALAGEPVTVAGDGGRTRSLCYVDDTVEGVLLVAASRSVRPVDIGGDEEATLAEIARRVVALTGSDSVLEFTGGSDDAPGRRRPATGFARELLGWTPRVPWDEGLKRTVAHALGRGTGRGRRS